MRVIKLTENIVTEVKFVNEGYVCQESEYESEKGNIGQRKLTDGTFEDVDQEVAVSEPTIEEKILFEMQYQTTLLEMNTPT